MDMARSDRAPSLRVPLLQLSPAAGRKGSVAGRSRSAHQVSYRKWQAMPLNNFTPETVREWRIYIKEYVAELPVNKDGHTMFSFDDAVGLQILQRDLAEMTRLS